MSIRESITLVEIDAPRCSRTYGVAPCTAALGTTGDAKCYNSRKTCQDTANFDPSETVTLRFARDQEGILQYGPVIPSIDADPATTPLKINLGGMEKSISPLGRREAITVKLKDHNYSDLQLDKYRLERSTGAAQVSAGEVDFPFAQTASLTARHGSELAAITFTRAGATATRVNEQGLIETVAADTPRFDYDPVTLECKGLLIEEARTNILLRSNDFADAYWVKRNVTVTANQAIGPDGLMSLAKIASNIAGNANLQSSNMTTTAQRYTAFCYLRAGNTDKVSVALFQNDIGGVAQTATILRGPGVITNQGTTQTQISGLDTDELTVVAVTLNVNAAAGNLNLYIKPGQGGSSQIGDYVYAGFAQTEAGAFPTSYIPTTTAEVTRNADLAKVADIGGFLNASEGTIVAEADVIPGGAAQRLFTFDKTASATYADMIQGWVNDAADLVPFEVFSGGVGQTSISPVGFTDTTVRQAAAYKANDFAEAVNGALTTDSAGLIPAVDQLFLGSYGKDSTYLNGHLRRFTYYPKRLSNADLQALSSGVEPATFFTNAYDPRTRGTFWGKFFARHPYYTSYPCRIREGFIGDALDDMRVRNYILDSIAGPSNGVVTVRAQDLFSLIERRKAVAPTTSTAELAAGISDSATSATLSPTGIGDSEFGPLETLMGTPGSGYVTFGDEICAYTRVADTLTLTRAQKGTEPASHDEGDTVQWNLVIPAMSPQAIIAFLLENFSEVPSSTIDFPAWDAAVPTTIGLLSAHIGAPEAVADLIGEICEQSGITLWPDVTTGMIELRALRSRPSLETLDDHGWIIDGSFSHQREEEKRVSRVVVHYAQINPLDGQKDAKNYRIHLVMPTDGADLYGTESVREVFSRWIPSTGRAIATACGERLTAMFKNPPIAASLRTNATKAAAAEFSLAAYVDLEAEEIQNADGSQGAATCAIVSMKGAEEETTLELQQVSFGEDDGVRRIFIDEDSVDVNLRELHDAQFPVPVGGEIVEITVSTGVKVTGSTATIPSLDTGNWPAGVTLSIEFAGEVLGKGGKGGDGGSGLAGTTAAFVGAASNGQAGGTAFKARYAITVSGSGAIRGGGGGGGAGGGAAVVATETPDDPPLTRKVRASGGGGGGGGGAGAGIAGSGGSATNQDGGVSISGASGASGSLSTLGAAGSGGHAGNSYNDAVVFALAGAGGRGGDYGEAGVDGSAATASASGDDGGASIATATGSSGGAAGKAVEGNAFITWDPSNTITINGALT